MNLTSLKLLTPYDSEGTTRLSLRNFKHAMNSMKSLSLYQIDNLTKFMDKANEGFISIDEFEINLKGAVISMGGTSSFALTGKRTEKWK